MLSNTEKLKLQAMMTTIVFSTIWSYSTTGTVEQPQAQTTHLGNTHKIEMCVENEKETKKKLQIVTGKGVKKESVYKARELVNTYLEDKNWLDKMVITFGTNIHGYGKKLNVDLQTVEDGDILYNSEDIIEIIVAEDEVDNILPSMLMSLNEHMRNKRGNYFLYKRNLEKK